MKPPSLPGRTAPRRRIVLLGATGSIGENALRVLRTHPDRLELAGIASRTRAAKLAEIAREFSVRHVALHDEAAYAEARRSPDMFPAGTRLYGGPAGLAELACLPEADTILVAVVGTAGLEPALAALAAGKTLALAS
ncbi:MAG: Gfo/Idh/MocA family oxidoreductase, partial [Opitutaceae bacterium]